MESYEMYIKKHDEYVKTRSTVVPNIRMMRDQIAEMRRSKSNLTATLEGAHAIKDNIQAR